MSSFVDLPTTTNTSSFEDVDIHNDAEWVIISASEVPAATTTTATNSNDDGDNNQGPSPLSAKPEWEDITILSCATKSLIDGDAWQIASLAGRVEKPDWRKSSPSSVLTLTSALFLHGIQSYLSLTWGLRGRLF